MEICDKPNKFWWNCEITIAFNAKLALYKHLLDLCPFQTPKAESREIVFFILINLSIKHRYFKISRKHVTMFHKGKGWSGWFYLFLLKEIESEYILHNAILKILKQKIAKGDIPKPPRIVRFLTIGFSGRELNLIRHLKIRGQKNQILKTRSPYNHWFKPLLTFTILI